MQPSLPLVMALCLAGCSFWEELPVEDTPEEVVIPVERSGGMVLVRAKDSSFKMGSASGAAGATAQPVHTVSFTHDFWMDTTEVTQARFDQVMAAAYPGYSAGAWEDAYGKGDRHPVLGRNWYDAALYCNALSKQAGLDTVYRFDTISGTLGNGCELGIVGIDSTAGYRLPTEAQWEYACRAGTTDDFFWGSGVVGEYAWYADNSSATANRVAGKKSNRFGIYDMSGNVAEWCNDWYAAYEAGDAIDPEGPATGNYRVVRGGNFGSEDRALVGSAARTIQFPWERKAGTGFRTVRRKT